MKILIAIDRSEYAEIVLEHGLDEAARRPDAELHIATFVGDGREIEAAQRWLEAFVRDGVEAFEIADRPLTLHVERGEPVAAIAALASELAADLLVIGRFHVPSTSEAILEAVECPTLVVGVAGHVLEPQCPACRVVRRDSDGERLFCPVHDGDRLPELVSRLSTSTHSRLW